MSFVTLFCKQCNNEFIVKYKCRKRKFCSKICLNASLCGSGNPSYRKTYRTKETHPDWAKKISVTSKDREINKGDKNGMKNIEVRKRQSKTRSYKFATDPTWKENVSKSVKALWEKGVYDNVSVGKCKWYNHIKPDGTNIKLQGTWEVVFAKHMDKMHIEYDAHKGKIKYFQDGKERSYMPDFYIPSINLYVDVKGAFFDFLQFEKFNCIKKSNPEINIFLVTKSVFQELNIDISKESMKILKS